MWLDIHFEWFDPYKHLIFAGRKELVGTKNDILIDDSIENVECFEAAGGNAFKFEKWNEITFNEICRKIDYVYERNRNE